MNMKDKVVEFIGWTGFVAMLVSYAPQLYLTLSTQNVTGQSVIFWGLLTWALFSTTQREYINYKNDKSSGIIGLLFQSFNFTCALVMFISVIVFK